VQAIIQSVEYASSVHHITNSNYTSGGQPVRDQEPHFSLCYRKEPHHTHGHT